MTDSSAPTNANSFWSSQRIYVLVGDILAICILAATAAAALALVFFGNALLVETLAADAGFGRETPASFGIFALAGIALVQLLLIVRDAVYYLPTLIAEWLEYHYMEVVLLTIIVLLAVFVMLI